eukprot:m.241392 g.241392  ORF g.241392 m.241392 type:complete len:188 (+) comp13838_c0_seq1:208-771(+)
MLLVWNAVRLLLALALPVALSQDYCAMRNNVTGIGCQECVDINVLTGISDCAYCFDPYAGEAACAKAYHSPALEYVCYRETPDGLFPATARCAKTDCYYQQCIFNSVVLWYYIVPSVVGGIAVIVGVSLWCYCRARQRESTRKWVDNENKMEQETHMQLELKAHRRKQTRKARAAEIRRKYDLDFDA